MKRVGRTRGNGGDWELLSFIRRTGGRSINALAHVTT